MIEFEIMHIAGNNFLLQDTKSKKQYVLNLTFYDLERNPQVGDFIAMHTELLDKEYAEYSTNYQFGPIDQVYGRKVTSISNLDCIVLLLRDEKIVLKRFFG